MVLGELEIDWFLVAMLNFASTLTHLQAAPNNYYVVKRGFRPSLLDWRLHVSPYFETAKRVRPLMVEQPARTEVPKSRMNRDLDTVRILFFQGLRGRKENDLRTIVLFAFI